MNNVDNNDDDGDDDDGNGNRIRDIRTEGNIREIEKV